VLNSKFLQSPSENCSWHRHVTVLRDANLTLVGPLGIRDQGGNPAGGDVFRTAHIVVDRGGKVISTSFGENYRIR